MIIPKRRGFRAAHAAIAVLLASSLLACGSGGADEVSTGGLTGEPIKVLTQYTTGTTSTNSDEIKVAAEAAAEYINTSGGINGRPIEVVACNGKYEQNASVACVQDGISQGIVAEAGGETNYGDAAFPLLEKAGLTHIGTWTRSAADTTSSASYPIIAPNVAMFRVAGQVVVQEGARTVSALGVDSSAAQALGGFARAGIQAAGGSFGQYVPVAVDAADFAPPVASLTSNTDGAVLLVGPQATLQVLRTIRNAGGVTAGYPVALSGSGLPTDPAQSIDPKYLDGLLVLDPLPSPTDDPRLKRYADLISQRDPDATLSGFALNTFLSYLTLADALRTSGDVSPAGLKARLDTGGPVDTGLAKVDFATPKPVGPWQRIFDSTFYLSTFRDGNKVPVREVTPLS